MLVLEFVDGIWKVTTVARALPDDYVAQLSCSATNSKHSALIGAPLRQIEPKETMTKIDEKLEVNSETNGLSNAMKNYQTKTAKHRHNSAIGSASSSIDNESVYDESEKDKNRLYKTEMCRSWVKSHTCNYGEKCQYAHGEHELRPIPRHPKYKTQLCKTFTARSYCPYGPRCHFIHGIEEAKKVGANYQQMLAELNGTSNSTVQSSPQRPANAVQQSIIDVTTQLNQAGAGFQNMPLLYDVSSQQLNMPNPGKYSINVGAKKNTTPLSNDSPYGGSLAGSFSGSASPNSCYSPNFQPITSDYDEDENKNGGAKKENTWKIGNWNNDMAFHVHDISMPPPSMGRPILKHSAQHQQLTATKSAQSIAMPPHVQLRQTLSDVNESEYDILSLQYQSLSMAPQPAPVTSARLPVFAQLSARQED